MNELEEMLSNLLTASDQDLDNQAWHQLKAVTGQYTNLRHGRAPWEIMDHLRRELITSLVNWEQP